MGKQTRQVLSVCTAMLIVGIGVPLWLLGPVPGDAAVPADVTVTSTVTSTEPGPTVTTTDTTTLPPVTTTATETATTTLPPVTTTATATATQTNSSTVHQTSTAYATKRVVSTHTYVLPGAVTTLPGATITRAGVVTTLPPRLITGPPVTLTATTTSITIDSAQAAADAQLAADRSGIWGNIWLYIVILALLLGGSAYGLYSTIGPGSTPNTGRRQH